MLAIERLIEIELLCSGILRRIEVLELDIEFLKIILFFKDGTNLRVAELWNDKNLIKYSYYWFSSDKEMKIGWDNAPHHKQVKTFPHHKHIYGNKIVQPSAQKCLKDVIAYIFEE